MKIYRDVEQRSDEWFALRSGKLTASLASKLVTPTGKPSVQYKSEIARIIAERLGLQKPEDVPPTYWIERGKRLEEEARAWYMVETGHDVEEVGFVSDDSDLIGASPDGLIPAFVDRGGNQRYTPLELKVPKPSTHIRWLLDGSVPNDHIAQVHFQMVLCNSKLGYFCSYCPDVEPLIVKVEWSDFTDTMVKAIDEYKTEFVTAYKTITGVEP